MKEISGNEIENELIETFIDARRKGMTPEQFFAMADATIEHLRGRQQNETVQKIIDNNATSADVKKMIASLKHKP